MSQSRNPICRNRFIPPQEKSNEFLLRLECSESKSKIRTAFDLNILCVQRHVAIISYTVLFVYWNADEMNHNHLS